MFIIMGLPLSRELSGVVFVISDLLKAGLHTAPHAAWYSRRVLCFGQNCFRERLLFHPWSHCTLFLECPHLISISWNQSFLSLMIPLHPVFLPEVYRHCRLSEWISQCPNLCHHCNTCHSIPDFVFWISVWPLPLRPRTLIHFISPPCTS